MALLARIGLAAPAPVIPPFQLDLALLNTSLLRYREVPFDSRNISRTWSVDGSGGACSPAPFTEANVSAASSRYGLFDNPCGRPRQPSGGASSLGEWGYEFMRFTEQMHKDNGFPCGEKCLAAVPAPGTREEALKACKTYYLCRWEHASSGLEESRRDGPGVFEFTGHFYFTHYGALWAKADVIGVEIAENINSMNAHLAFVRGAARQFAVPFKVDVSPWYVGFITDYTGHIWGDASKAAGDGGHSLSLYKRAYHAVFASGAGSLLAEAGQVNWLLETPREGVLQLSPLGTIGRDFYNFSHSMDRGIPYVPAALLVEEAHGMGLGWWQQGKSWDRFPLTNQEHVLTDLLAVWWPTTWDQEPASKEVGYMVASPLGESLDVLLAGSQLQPGLLSAYRLLVLAGDVGASIAELLAYAQAGGTVLFNAAHLDANPDLLQLSGLRDVKKASVSVANMSSADGDWGSGPSRPFCVESAGAWYIKVGGSLAKQEGWDGGVEDKCCRTDANTCHWFTLQALCHRALEQAQCRSCAGEVSGLGCPAWEPVGDATKPFEVTLGSLADSARPLLIAAAPSPVPLVTVNEIGDGRAIFFAVAEAEPLRTWGISKYVLQRLLDDVTPIDVRMAANSADARPRIQVATNVNAAGFVVTLTNNWGVTKLPSKPAAVDASARVAVELALKPAFGVASGARVVGESGACEPLSGGGRFRVDIEAGDVAVVEICVAAREDNGHVQATV